MKSPTTRRGFTVVELIVVISVVAILAAITYFILSGWRVETAKTEVTSQLKVIESEITAHRTFKNGYPTALSQISYEATKTVDVTYSYRSVSDTYCLYAKSNVEPSVQYIIDTRDGKHLEKGVCAP